MILTVLLAALLFCGTALAQCGPPQCYKARGGACTDARPQVDFVFLIDISGSMKPKIDGVRSGLSDFAASLDANAIDPKYAVVTFGGTSPLDTGSVSLDFTGDVATFKNKLVDLGNYVINVGGGWEPGLEAITEALRTSATGQLSLSFRTGQNTQKVFILVTDEDSDPAVKSGNRFQSSTTRDALCRGSAPNPSQTVTAISTSTWNSQWQPEVDKAYNSLVGVDASLYMFVTGTKTLQQDSGLNSVQTCNVYYQYCNPTVQSQASDYTNFNAAATLTSITNLGQQGSLQGKYLSAGKVARCFEVVDTKDATLIKNFFSQIVSDVSKCQTCYDYLCSAPTSGFPNGQCQTPTYICGCDGVPNSGKTLDSQGNCCLPSARDCRGICNGNYVYDACGVCVAPSTTYAQCKTDCNGNKYLDLPPNPTSLSTYSTLIYRTSCPDVAGYLLQNPDLLTAYQSSWKNTAAVCNHFHVYGRFEGRYSCTFDAARYASDYGVSQATAKDNWLAAQLLAANLRTTAYCTSKSRVKFPPLLVDSCGQCIINADLPPYCVQDCHGNWNKASDSPYFYDNCGYCVAPGTNPDGHKDTCGVCDGGNAAKNECNICFGPRGNDACGQLICLNQVCNKDCDNVSRNPLLKQVDECGNCVWKTDVRDAKCKQDCKGVWYMDNPPTSNTSPNIVDECHICVPRAQVRSPLCIQDCNGVWNGTSFLDDCNQCIVNGVIPYPCRTDCNGGRYREGKDTPAYTNDDCGICYAAASPLRNSLKDNCAVCTNTPGYVTATQCTQDCKGQWLPSTSALRAFVDLCKTCWFANQTSQTNLYMDDCGECHCPAPVAPATFVQPTACTFNGTGWNGLQTETDTQGAYCACNAHPKACPNSNFTTCNDYCPTDKFCPGTSVTPDSCGRCPNSPQYNSGLDQCGQCCDSLLGVTCNQDKDSCGVCFGYDKDKQNPCGVCDPNGTLCVKDCAGVYGGNSTYGCNGVCGYTGACIRCGNGVVEGSETCDNGVDSQGNSLNGPGTGCSDTCQVEAGQNNAGAIAGGIIGAIAGIAFLAGAAFLALRYAQKAGLIGSANKQVDMGASNSNPLYKSEVAVHQNPLYETS